MHGTPKIRSCVLSLAAAALVHAGESDHHLAALQYDKLPEPKKSPNWASGGVPAEDEGEDGQNETGSSDVVFQWLQAAKQQNYPKVSSRGWRILRTAPTDTQEWCITRLQFFTKDSVELKPSTSGCRVEATGQDLLRSDYQPRHAFSNNAREGCTLKDSQLGDWAIGLICDDWHKVDKIAIMQMTHDTASSQVRVQQMQAGRWIDVGKPVATPQKNRKVIFQAATCHDTTCTQDRKPLTGKLLPAVCSTEGCSEDECCTSSSEVVGEWSMSPVVALSGAGHSVGSFLGIATSLVALVALVAAARAWLPRAVHDDPLQLDEPEATEMLTRGAVE